MPLRAATRKDASSIAALSIEVWSGTYLKRGINSFFANYMLSEFTEAKTSALLSSTSEHFIVSDNADGIDGFIRVSTNAKAPVACGSTTEIATFYVQPRHHGKGIGKALLNAALQQCRTLNANSVWLATNSENHPAIGFYRAQGFTQIGHTHFRVQTQEYLNNVYLYDLTTAKRREDNS